jgi:hypothetical protein
MTKPIQIRNEDVVRNLRELAARRQKPITEMIGEMALGELARDQHRENVGERRSEIARILSEIDALSHLGPPLTDDELYDENGLPR